jgi:predicted Rdx family selenoprotein
LKEAFDVDAKLIAGSGGIFDVTVDGKRLYCKHETGKFPDKGEVVALLQ